MVLRRSRSLAVAIVFLVAPHHTNAEIVPSLQLPPELARVLADYETAWRAKDATALARLFAENGFVLAGGNPMIRGRSAIESFYGAHGGPLFLRAVAYAVQGTVGYIIGGYADRPGVADQGKFTLTLQKDGSGRWLIMSDMDNGNQRPGTPSTPPAGSPH